MFDLDFSTLQKGKNLLAFSGGVDSSALFFLLQKQAISFDLIHVNYHTRQSSDAEADYAKELARQYGKRVFILDAQLEEGGYEAQARKIRYDFFEQTIREEGYQNLITAHQLNDQTEWFLMQLTKGAGSLELLGMQPMDSRDGYRIVRPLLEITKKELLEYLQAEGIRYFEDESNLDQRFKRNYFRHNFSDRLLDEFKEGIKQSFRFLARDRDLLLEEIETLYKDELTVIRFQHKRQALFAIDKDLKRRGYILSYAQRQEILKENSIVISDRFVIEWQEKRLFIAPYVDAVMPKAFKEACRVRKIPLKIRPFLFSRDIAAAQIDII